MMELTPEGPEEVEGLPLTLDVAEEILLLQAARVARAAGAKARGAVSATRRAGRGDRSRMLSSCRATRGVRLRPPGIRTLGPPP